MRTPPGLEPGNTTPALLAAASKASLVHFKIDLHRRSDRPAELLGPGIYGAIVKRHDWSLDLARPGLVEDFVQPCASELLLFGKMRSRFRTPGGFIELVRQPSMPGVS